MPARRRLASLLAAAALLAACGGGSEPGAATPPPGSPSDGTRAPAATTAAGPDAGEPTEVPGVLDFVAVDVRGGEIVGADLAGQDVVLWFWAPW